MVICAAAKNDVVQPRIDVKMTDNANIAALKPCLVSLKAGRPYAWCSCGHSSKQPFCDGSHQGTGFEPLRYVPEKDEEVLLCACKHTRSAPFCDGSHNDLSETYAEAAPEDFADALNVDYQSVAGQAFETASLDNGCYVLRGKGSTLLDEDTTFIGELISGATGARHLAQYYVLVQSGTTPVLSFPGAEVVIYLAQGEASVSISSREFAMPVETGAYVRAGEAFSLSNHDDSPLQAIITVCPGEADLVVLDEMPGNFDADCARRTRSYNIEERDHMADRHLMELVNHELGCEQVTQFIGEVPKSRAAFHHHLYEEAIYIISGSGTLWNQETKADVVPGDIIFLPERQAHSLECTDNGGMRLMGVFYPAGSPKVNY